jgi:hypothetical protein
VLHDDRHRVSQVGHDHLDPETLHAIPGSFEHSIATRVGAAATRVSRPLANSAASALQTVRSRSACRALLEQKHDTAMDLSRPGEPQQVSFISGHEDPVILERELENLAIGASKSTAVANVDHINEFAFPQTLRDAWRQLLIEQ